MSDATALPETLLDAIRYFADLDVSTQFVAELRWPDGPVCPVCTGKEVSYLSTRRTWKCKACKKQFSVKLGTIFEDSPLGLDKWLPALWMLANCKNGVSSYELARALGVTQKTAWFMLSRIRLAMQTRTFEKLRGTVEADETFVGGRSKNMHKAKRERVTPSRGATHMQAVFGMLERKAGEKHSTVRLAHVATTRKHVLEHHLRENVAHGSSVFTDSHPTYRRLARMGFGVDYRHAAVDHAVEYVRGEVHTNGLENFWSLLKRTIKGTYVSVDPFHLFRYLDEQAYRYNSRKAADAERFVDTVRRIVGKRLTYQALISAGMTPART